MKSNRLLRMAQGASVIVGLLALAALFFPQVAGALPTQLGGDSAFGSFTAIGDANGLSIEVDDPSAPLVANGQLVFASDTSSQAQVDSLGESQAFSSVPYPGPLVSTLPNLINGLTSGQFPPLPTYPLLVSSQYPTTPRDQVSQGPYQMTASSQQNEARATGIIAVSDTAPSVAEVSTTAAATQNSDGSVTATATTSTNVVDFGPNSLLQIDGVESSAAVSQTPGGALQRTAHLTAAAIRVGGVALALTDRGLQLAGTSIPILGLDSTLTVLLNSLSASGISLSVLPAKKLPDGVESAALQVIEQRDIPGQGNVVATVTFGGAVATVSSSSVPNVPSAPLPGSGSTAPAGTVPPVSVSPVRPLSSTAASAAPVTATPSNLHPSSSLGHASNEPAARQDEELIHHPLSLNGSASVFYLILLASAAVTLVGTELLRRVAVRLQLSRRRVTT